MRVGYRIDLGGGRTLDVFGDIFNVTNRANFASPSGNMAVSNTANFLNLTETLQGNSNPQLLQLGARFAFQRGMTIRPGALAGIRHPACSLHSERRPLHSGGA
jgi:hypothetical protein